MSDNIKKWVLAMRPKTLSVSMAPVIMAAALAFSIDKFQFLPFLLCLIFAVLAQITSNFVNDYADFKNNSDDSERLGPERMVASGKIKPRNMMTAFIVTASFAFLVGLSLIYWGGWILLPFGIIIMIVAFTYSLGPFPLSYNGLGDVAAILFYGMIPVTFTYYILTGSFPLTVIIAGFAMGIVVDELMIVNNYRDVEQDASHNKKTTVVLLGKKFMKAIFFLNPLVAVFLGFYFMRDFCDIKMWQITVIPFLIYSLIVVMKFNKSEGKQFNRLIGMASLGAVLFSLTVMLVIIL